MPRCIAAFLLVFSVLSMVVEMRSLERAFALAAVAVLTLDVTLKWLRSLQQPRSIRVHPEEIL